jgi:hypothetical protein
MHTQFLATNGHGSYVGISRADFYQEVKKLLDFPLFTNETEQERINETLFNGPHSLMNIFGIYQPNVEKYFEQQADEAEL